VPYRVLGRMRAVALHDQIVSRRLEKLAGKIDIIHTWPLGALQTLKTAARLGIPTVLERPNAHTGSFYEAVQRECAQLGISIPPEHEHAFNAEVLGKEEEEYRLADRLLCPSEFALRTFLTRGFPRDKLVRHSRGFDERVYYPDNKRREPKQGLTMLFAGTGSPAKGLHYALEAWLQSPAHREGKFLIAGAFIPDYAERLSSMLSHPSIQVLGFRKDVPELMRRSDVLVLPSISEGFGLVTLEGRGSGCVLLVSDACCEACKHMENGLVHRVGDVATLAQHITMLHEDRALLERLRAASLSTAHGITWTAAGAKLLQVYKDILASLERN
jgi:glycosyltransferase involved in cell wall biosynthesis